MGNLGCHFKFLNICKNGIISDMCVPEYTSIYIHLFIFTFVLFILTSNYFILVRKFSDLILILWNLIEKCFWHRKWSINLNCPQYIVGGSTPLIKLIMYVVWVIYILY